MKMKVGVYLRWNGHKVDLIWVQNLGSPKRLVKLTTLLSLSREKVDIFAQFLSKSFVLNKDLVFNFELLHVGLT